MHQGEVSKQRARSPRYAGFAPLGPGAEPDQGPAGSEMEQTSSSKEI